MLQVAARLYVLYVLALFLGLRRGELLGLRWVDVDLDGEKLEVVQALQRVGGKLRFVKPKTEDSERTVPLPQFCVAALREHKKRQFAERSDAWPDWDDHGLDFPSRRGTPMEPDNLRRSWSTIRDEAGLGETRLHDLRHTCVTLLQIAGVASDASFPEKGDYDAVRDAALDLAAAHAGRQREAPGQSAV